VNETNGTGSAPAVSIIIPTRNRPALLRAALESVARQTLRDFECLVIDDGSGAETVATYEELWRNLDGRFHLHRPPAPGLPGSGAGPTRNRGLRRARGQFVAFCDDDDRWCLPDHLEVAVTTLTQHGADFFFADMRREGDGGAALPNWFAEFPGLAAGLRLRETPAVHEVSLATLTALLCHFFPHLNTCVVRRSLLEEVGGFYTRLSVGDDVNLMLRLTDRARRVLYRPEPVAATNCSTRHSVTRDTADIDRCLQALLSCQHIQAVCMRGPVRHSARSVESWHLRELGDLLLRQGRGRAALALAWQAWAVNPSLGSTRHLLGTLVRAWRTF
jgi:glycosyltransferase involved in cell wall biosynthesis